MNTLVSLVWSTLLVYLYLHLPPLRVPRSSRHDLVWFGLVRSGPWMGWMVGNLRESVPSPGLPRISSPVLIDPRGTRMHARLVARRSCSLIKGPNHEREGSAQREEERASVVWKREGGGGWEEKEEQEEEADGRMKKVY